MSKDHFTLQQKEPGKAYQACFCLFGEKKWWGTKTAKEREARRQARNVQDAILKELAVKAALNGKETPGFETKAVPDTSAPNPDSATTIPRLDSTQPAPKGSFRELIEEEVAFVEKNKPSKHKWRDVTDAQKHLYEALGGYVDLPRKRMDGGMGDRLAAFYNNPDKFRLCGENYATMMRRFLRPTLDRGLPREFFAALDKVKKQSNDDEASDPLMADHFRRIALRLETGLEEDYITGLHLLGCNAGPQIRDAALLRWEGIDTKTEPSNSIAARPTWSHYSK